MPGTDPSEHPSPVTRFDKSGDAFEVRLYRPGDREELERFYEAFEPKRGAQGLPPIGRARVTRWLDSVLPVGIHLVATRGDALIGHCFLVPMARPAAAEYAVFLDREQRGKGVGTELNRVAIEHARESGYQRLWLSVEPHNRAAIRSYEKTGFRFRNETIFSSEPEMTLDL